MFDFLTTHDLHKSYGHIQVLKGINLTLERGKLYSIQGPSGSGKSTLLHLIAGLDEAAQGSIFFEGININSLNDKEKASYRNQNIGIIFQFHFLLPTLNLWQNILLPAQIGGHGLKDVKAHCKNLCEHLGIQDLLEKFPYQISGGEQQRVNLVRALSLRPPLLLCDEPTGNLDSHNSERVMNLLTRLSRELQTTLLFVTHNEKLVKNFDRNYTMQDGLLN